MTMSVNELAAELKTLTPAQIDLIAAALNLAKKEAPCTTAIVQSAKSEHSQAQDKNTTYLRNYQDLIYSCSVYEVKKAREIFDSYMRDHVQFLDAPGAMNMSKDVLLECSLAQVWKAAKLYFAEHAERCPR